MNYHWPTREALEVLHGDKLCETCGGRAWVAVADPLFPGALIDARCPACCAAKRSETRRDDRS